jgi:hypothetical protein
MAIDIAIARMRRVAGISNNGAGDFSIRLPIDLLSKNSMKMSLGSLVISFAPTRHTSTATLSATAQEGFYGRPCDI